MEQLDCLFGGRNVEFIVQGADTEAVLTAHELLLILRCVAAHKHSMGRLTTWVAAHSELGKPHSIGKLAELKVDLRKLFQCLQIQLFQIASLG